MKHFMVKIDVGLSAGFYCLPHLPSPLPVPESGLLPRSVVARSKGRTLSYQPSLSQFTIQCRGPPEKVCLTTFAEPKQEEFDWLRKRIVQGVEIGLLKG